MAILFNKAFSKHELLHRVGDMSQIAGVHPVEFTEGKERGIRALRFYTGSGFQFTVLIDRAMDIFDASFNGASICWHSSAGPTGPEYYDPREKNWLWSFAGGLLTTCGLQNAGDPADEDNQHYGLHGRIANTPAKSVSWGTDWEQNDYVLWAAGTVRESRLFGPNLVLKRSIHAKLGQSKIWIQDEIENQGYEESELMLVYHYNMGFPVVDTGSELLAVIEDLEPFNKNAQNGIDTFDVYEEPIAGISEQCFSIEQDVDENGIVNVAIVNRQFNNNQGIGVYLAYPKAELPRYTQWKMMGQGNYVVGMEPGTCLPEGRKTARKRGDLINLLPGGKIITHMEIGVLESNNDIRSFESKLRGMDL